MGDLGLRECFWCDPDVLLMRFWRDFVGTVCWCGWAVAAVSARPLLLEYEAGAMGEMGGALVTQTR